MTSLALGWMIGVGIGLVVSSVAAPVGISLIIFGALGFIFYTEE